MPLVTHRPFTVHDYRELPDNGPRYQLVEGDLYMAPAPNRFHQTYAGKIYSALDNWLDAHPVGKAYVAPFDVHLTDLNVYQPDVCYFSSERYACLTREGANGAPELAVEVLSPSSAHLDLGLKKEIYTRTGVLEYWIVDPDTRLVKVYHLPENSQAPAFTLDKTGTLTTRLLPGFRLPLTKVFVE
ncbi:MAG: Uma2 family endonuclease [Opitutaceae bacterium]|nr:Uma2 family endonuclease [Opitutaceae bacterium]